MRLIDFDELINAFREFPSDREYTIREIARFAKGMRTVGLWVCVDTHEKDFDLYECSLCKGMEDEANGHWVKAKKGEKPKQKFCEWCGARMI